MDPIQKKNKIFQKNKKNKINPIYLVKNKLMILFLNHYFNGPHPKKNKIFQKNKKNKINPIYLVKNKLMILFLNHYFNGLHPKKKTKKAKK
jgi:hypothetical protein